MCYLVAGRPTYVAISLSSSDSCYWSCRLHCSGNQQESSGSSRESNTFTQHEMQSGLPDVMPVSVRVSLSRVAWHLPDKASTMLPLRGMPYPQSAQEDCVCLHNDMRMSVNIHIYAETWYAHDQATDEGSGPSLSEEEMKQRKTKAVMSWLVCPGSLLLQSFPQGCSEHRQFPQTKPDQTVQAGVNLSHAASPALIGAVSTAQHVQTSMMWCACGQRCFP